MRVGRNPPGPSDLVMHAGPAVRATAGDFSLLDLRGATAGHAKQRIKSPLPIVYWLRPRPLTCASVRALVHSVHGVVRRAPEIRGRIGGDRDRRGRPRAVRLTSRCRRVAPRRALAAPRPLGRRPRPHGRLERTSPVTRARLAAVALIGRPSGEEGQRLLVAAFRVVAAGFAEDFLAARLTPAVAERDGPLAAAFGDGDAAVTFLAPGSFLAGPTLAGAGGHTPGPAWASGRAVLPARRPFQGLGL